MEFDNLEPMPTECVFNHKTPWDANDEHLEVGKTYHVVAVDVHGSPLN